MRGDAPGREPLEAAPGGTDAAPAQGHRGFELLARGLEASAAGEASIPPELLLNMELSNLAFQERVLDLAADRSYPLLERVRFVSIFGSNMDEFFMTRVAGFQRQLGMKNEKRTLDGLLPIEQLQSIRGRVDDLFSRVYGEILPELSVGLRTASIEIVRAEELREEERRSIRYVYGTSLHDLLSPLPVSSGVYFPHVRNLRPTLAVRLRRSTGEERMVLVTLPDSVPLLVALPGGRRFLPLEDVVRMSLPGMFYDAEILGAHAFRATRSGNLTVQPDGSLDVVEVVEENVARRPFAPVVRLEVEEGMPSSVESLLLRELSAEAFGRSSHLGASDVYRAAGILDLKRLQIMASLPLDDLRFPRRQAKTPIPREAPFFERIRRRPVLMEYPRHAFGATLGRFIREAADDPLVEEIRVTLYRTNRSSTIVRLLQRARRRGKRVVVFIEVKASFDEHRNIEWGRSLEGAGIRVLYGPPSLKVHAKIALIRRREDEGLVTYSYIGTGNLNAATASAYTDLGLFTADPAIGDELVDLFEALADEEARGEYGALLVAPFNMRRRFLDLIARETRHAREGVPAAITAKLNGIADREIIAALYDASRAGVRIDLVVRGICSLRPGVPGWSENIRVVANAGRYLEHSRIYRFENAGDPEYYIGSADWRGRNLSRRVEVVVPVRRASHRRVLDTILEDRLNDPSGWDLLPSGVHLRRSATAG
jgi:polyphosphate kinase